jgi:hypothetical protein
MLRFRYNIITGFEYYYEPIQEKRRDRRKNELKRVNYGNISKG